MIKLTKTIQLLALVAIFSSCGFQQEEFVGNSFEYSYYGYSEVPKKWHTNDFPISLKVSSNQYGEGFSDIEINEINNAIDEWNQSAFNSTQFFHHQAIEVGNPNNAGEGLSLSNYRSRYSNDHNFGIYKINQSWPFSHDALAVTITSGDLYNVGHSSEHFIITGADILFNYVNENSYRTEDSINSNLFDFRLIMTHELGHLLGMNHAYLSMNESVMAPNILRSHDLPEVNHLDASLPRSIFLRDINVINDIYSISNPNLLALSSSQDEKKWQNISQKGPIKTIIIQELKKDGSCVHRINDKIIETHRVNLK